MKHFMPLVGEGGGEEREREIVSLPGVPKVDIYRLEDRSWLRQCLSVELNNNKMRRIALGTAGWLFLFSPFAVHKAGLELKLGDGFEEHLTAKW